MKIRSSRFWLFFDKELVNEHYNDVLFVPYLKYIQFLYRKLTNEIKQKEFEIKLAEIWRMGYPTQYIQDVITELEEEIYGD